jgi:hypothetical protein
MAKGNPHPGPGKRFGKDNPPPRGGRPPLPPEVREGRKINKKEAFEIVNKYAWMSITDAVKLDEQLKDGHKDVSTMSLFEIGVYRSCREFSKFGTLANIQFWMDHFVGKAPTPITGKGGAPLIPPNSQSVDLRNYTTEQIEQILEKME